METKQFKEYLQMFKKGLPNLDKVISGIITDIKMEHGDLPDDVVEEILKRRTICNSCEFNSENARTSKEYFDIFGKNYETTIDNLHCSLCSCLVSKKTASLESECGLHSREETSHLPLKWNKYK